ncbi:MAG: universal stress protein [Thermodesulfobacteriota bacterium]
MAMTYKKILYCTDFSEDADYALKSALDLSEKYQARLYCLHVVHSAYQIMPDLSPMEKNKEAEKTLSAEDLEKGKVKLKELYEPKLAGLTGGYEFQVVCGVPFMEIVRYARANEVDFIVLGAAGSSNIKRITFGSTAENVARRAHCTVMITRDPEKVF